jgi:FMN phosphatase YigB (HAD superfamily)
VLNEDPVVFMLDVDNTLLDNDRFAADLTARLDDDFGKPECERYWSIYAELRDRLGYADYLGALQAFRAGGNDEPALLRMAAFLLDYPFSERLYPRALAALDHLRTIGATAIVSDGDIVFQPRKIQHSGLWDAVDGRVLVTLHKERRLDLVQRRFPASHYVMIDDKPHLLAAMKRVLAGRLTTVFVRQGHYATASAGLAIDPAPDLTIERIGDLCALALADFHVATAGRVLDADRQMSSATNSQEQP